MGMKFYGRAGVIGAALTMAASAQGAIVYATNGLHRPLSGPDTLIRFDTSNPSAYTVVGSMAVSNIGFGGLDFDASGNLWAYASFYKNTGGAAAGLYRVDVNTGQATLQGTASLQSLQDMAYNPVDGKMYGVNSQANVTRLYEINLTTGATTNVGTFSGLPSAHHVAGFAFDSAGNIFLQDLTSDTMYTGSGLSLSALYALPYDANFSQGMTIDWSRDDQGYHNAVGYGVFPNYFSELYTFETDGSNYSLLGNFGPDLPDGLPPVECGDLAIMPVPAPGPLAALLMCGAISGCRRRR